MNCRKCGNVAIGGLNICRVCRNKATRENTVKNSPAVKAGYCHAGTGITDIPLETHQKIAQMRVEEARQAVEEEYQTNRERQANAIHAIEDSVKSFFQEIAEQIARDESRVKHVSQGVATCPECDRVLVDGECYRCRR